MKKTTWESAAIETSANYITVFLSFTVELTRLALTCLATCRLCVIIRKVSEHFVMFDVTKLLYSYQTSSLAYSIVGSVNRITVTERIKAHGFLSSVEVEIISFCQRRQPFAFSAFYVHPLTFEGGSPSIFDK